MTGAVVLGGGFAGVLAAAALTGHVDHVTLVEGGTYPAGPGPRTGIPQGHHSHVLATGGALAVEELLPGTLDALAEAGALRRGLTGNTLIRSADGWFHRHETGPFLISCSRWLLDHVVRARALAGGRVAVRERTRALALTGDAGRVTGVLLCRPDGGTEQVSADLVIDATGRRSRADRWLVDLGGERVEEEIVDPGLAYATRVYRAPSGLGSQLPAIMIHPQPGRSGHGGTLFPIEGDRWVVTLTGTRADQPPTDEHGFTDCAFGLASPVIAELIGVAKPVGEVRPYLATVNRRRYFERRHRPAGFVVCADALVAVNPVYSHGLAVAARSALRLSRELDRAGDRAAAGGPAELMPEVQIAMAAEADRSWQLATRQGGMRSASAAGPAPAAAPGHSGDPHSLRERVGTRMARAVLGDPDAMAAFFGSQALLTPEQEAKTVLSRALLREPASLLSQDEAIAQYPALRSWWGGERGR